MSFKEELQKISWDNSPLNIDNVKKALIEAAYNGGKYAELYSYNDAVVEWLKTEGFEVKEIDMCGTFIYKNGDEFSQKYLSVSWT